MIVLEPGNREITLLNFILGLLKPAHALELIHETERSFYPSVGSIKSVVKN